MAADIAGTRKNSGPGPLFFFLPQVAMPATSCKTILTGDISYNVEGHPELQAFDKHELLRRGYSESTILVTDTRRPLSDIAKDIERLTSEDTDLADFNLEWVHTPDGAVWPHASRILVSVLQGASEGWFLEIFALKRNTGPFRPADPDLMTWSATRLLSAKTFEPERIWLFARRVSEWLDLV